MSKKKICLLALPVLLIASTYFIFKIFVQLFGLKTGYFSGFLFYWIFWCTIVPLSLMGKGSFFELFKPMVIGKPMIKGIYIFMLVLPPVLAVFFGPFLSRIVNTNFIIFISSLALAIVNAFCEELLWRGLYTKIFDSNVLFGYILPAVGFSVWHIAPNAVNASKQGLIPFLAGALFIGLCWGFVAFKTKSIKWTIISHIVLDFSGIGALFYFS